MERQKAPKHLEELMKTLVLSDEPIAGEGREGVRQTH